MTAPALLSLPPLAVDTATLGLLHRLRDGLRRLDPAWCALNGAEQITDEELDDLIGELEEFLAPPVDSRAD